MYGNAVECLTATQEILVTWFDPRPGQKVFSNFSTVTFGTQSKITHPMARSTSMSKIDSWNV